MPRWVLVRNGTRLCLRQGPLRGRGAVRISLGSCKPCEDLKRCEKFGSCTTKGDGTASEAGCVCNLGYFYMVDGSEEGNAPDGRCVECQARRY